jgi:hypothetical protein
MDTPPKTSRNAAGQFVKFAGPGRFTLDEHEAKRKAEVATAARKAAEIAELDAIATFNAMIAARRPQLAPPKDDVFVPGGQARTSVIAGRRRITVTDKPHVRHHHPYDLPDGGVE